MNILEEVDQLKTRINNLEDRLEAQLDLGYKQEKIIMEMAELLNQKLGFDLLELSAYNRPKFVKNNKSKVSGLSI